jgi:hypothetical protein
MQAQGRGLLVVAPMVIRDWGEANAVVYALDDARTHLLPAAGAELLRWLAAAPEGAERDEIIAAWSATDGGGPDGEPADAALDAALLAQRVDELIDRLLGAGLLRAVAGSGDGQP